VSSTTGIVKLGAYSSNSVDANIDELLALLADPDSSSSSGAIAHGGLLDEMSPAALTQLRVELAAIKTASAGGGTSGQYTVVAADDTANLTNIVTGLADLTLANVAVSITRAGAIVTADAVISEPTAGTIRVADGSTYHLTAGDKINWAVVA
jgi:hypothetical protein